MASRSTTAATSGRNERAGARAPVAWLIARDTGPSNAEFLRGLQEACASVNVPLRVLPPDVHGGDRWIQDEVEFGFSESPTHSITGGL